MQREKGALANRFQSIEPLPRLTILVVIGMMLTILVGFGLAIFLDARNHEILLAARDGDAARVEEILSRHPERVELRSRLHETPLMEAAWTGRTRVLQVLINHGANVSATGGKPGSGDGEWNALHFVAIQGSSDAARVLIDAGTDINLRNLKGNTPLDLAVSNRNDELASLLREKRGKTGVEVAAEEHSRTPR